MRKDQKPKLKHGAKYIVGSVGRADEVQDHHVDRLVNAGVSVVINFLDRLLPPPFRLLAWPIDKLIKHLIKRHLKKTFPRLLYEAVHDEGSNELVGIKQAPMQHNCIHNLYVCLRFRKCNGWTLKNHYLGTKEIDRY